MKTFELLFIYICGINYSFKQSYFYVWTNRYSPSIEELIFFSFERELTQ